MLHLDIEFFENFPLDYFGRNFFTIVGGALISDISNKLWNRSEISLWLPCQQSLEKISCYLLKQVPKES